MLSFRAKALLKLQNGLGRMAAIILAPCYFALIRLMGYRIKDLKAVRAACRREFERHEGPWLICANHLTMVDSPLLSYAMLSLWTHLGVYRWIPWNLPERNNFRNPFLVLLCYLSKCIPVQRGGPRAEIKQTLAKCTYLLSRKQRLLIFPEGGRSRTGRVDTERFSYGVGRFLDNAQDDLRVMCLYFRGDGQASYSTVPAFGERFTVLVDVFNPEKSALTGLRAQRDYAAQIIGRLEEMEERYFGIYRQRHCGPDRSRQHREERRQPVSAASVYNP
ncbi:MAG: lysophospholipid acyltransferase family protein [Pseudomonadota bacterium]